MDHDALTAALDLLGRTLADRGRSYHVAIVGGSALLLTGEGLRPTQDVDVVAVASGGAALGTTWTLPSELCDAASDVAMRLGLSPDWLNAGAGAILERRLPDGYERRLRSRVYDGLVVSVLSRPDLVRLKVLAAIDEGVDSRHMHDLRRMAATRAECTDAVRWALRTHHARDPLLRDIARALDVELEP